MGLTFSICSVEWRSSLCQWVIVSKGQGLNSSLARGKSWAVVNVKSRVMVHLEEGEEPFQVHCNTHAFLETSQDVIVTLK